MATPPTDNPAQQRACRPCHDQSQNQHLQHYFELLENRRNDAGNDVTMTPEMERGEALLASAMNNLSRQERIRALEDVHCVGEELEETPDLVQKSLADFDQVVQQDQHPIYLLALNQNRAYVEDPAFRLKFLRANFYDVDKSVRQMTDFLFFKAKYFGEDKVAREITFSDMRKQDIEMMRSGLFHIQEGRDQMGRVIVHFFINKLSAGCEVSTVIRAYYYAWWNLVVPLPEVQMKGVNAISNHVALVEEESTMPRLSFFVEMIKFFLSVPVRVSVTHYCRYTATGNHSFNDKLISLILSHTSQYARVRTRVHNGSSMELRYQLRSHGIPLDTFPLDEDGNPRNEILNLWFDKHLQQTNLTVPYHRGEVAMVEPPHDVEIDLNLWNHALAGGNNNGWMQAFFVPGQVDIRPSNNEQGAYVAPIAHVAHGIADPTDTDVLFGKGYRMQSHPGNIRFREFLEQHRHEYEDIPRQQKREIVIRLAQTLRRTGVRFLQKSEADEWIESTVEEAEKKIAQYLRELRKKDLDRV